MHLVVAGATIAVCLLFPLALLVWLLRTRARSRLYFWSVAVLTAVVLVVVTASELGAWYAIGAFWPWLFAAAFTAILLRRILRGMPSDWLPRLWSREFFLTCVNLLFICAWGSFLPFLARASAYPGEPLALAPPLRGGPFYVMGGGANWTVNHHAFIPFQRYALDIVELDGLGLRASGISPGALEDYRIFGAEVVAPCDGEVLSVESGLPNRALLDPDTSHPFGNHVVLFCAGHSVLLGHMNAGSVTAAAGERVTTGQRLGTVGNSGSTMEPHLHVHAVEGRQADGRGEATPLRIGGVLLVKGDTFAN